MKKLYVLKLFVAGNNDKTQKIHTELNTALQQLTVDNFELELIDALVFPEKAKEFGVFATPTLIKQLPGPVCRVIGKLDDIESAIIAISTLIQEKVSLVN